MQDAGKMLESMSESAHQRLAELMQGKSFSSLAADAWVVTKGSALAFVEQYDNALRMTLAAIVFLFSFAIVMGLIGRIYRTITKASRSQSPTSVSPVRASSPRAAAAASSAGAAKQRQAHEVSD
eukprot:NODE_2426_length_608_cov_158.872987_g2064_i0.p1 GENE.NODE_2426_length_608_cov_158.872987_g2064_i0~~NODE_2426_length_608_cov_158.872987_g2064_i0.p1  ORF type:complete len:124 (+),score=1.04 NODE_2426_length_608_cov_158.872987_g2064_i0:62-433(+)